MIQRTSQSRVATVFTCNERTSSQGSHYECSIEATHSNEKFMLHSGPSAILDDVAGVYAYAAPQRLKPLP